VVQCLCNHATLFGSNFFVKPNKLDVGKQLSNLSNLADYPALLATICVIGGLYVLGMVWALRKDRKKTCKVSQNDLHCALCIFVPYSFWNIFLGYTPLCC
jgi:cytochrome bd-type quinol oxidase subunit 2